MHYGDAEHSGRERAVLWQRRVRGGFTSEEVEVLHLLRDSVAAVNSRVWQSRSRHTQSSLRALHRAELYQVTV